MSSNMSISVKGQAPSPGHAPTPVKAALAAFLGSMVEYYDFFIYGVMATLVLNKVFFTAADPATGTLLALATFGVAYVARPVGAFFLGHYGDKLGRKKVMVFCLLLMGVSTFLIGVLPDYNTVGLLAPALLVFLRLCQGLSAAGEQSGASSLTIEHAPMGRRAFFASWTLNGTQAGLILANLVFLPFAALPPEQLYSWGWRVPFLLSAVLVVIAFVVRRTLDDAPIFTELEEDRKVERMPIKALFRDQWRDILRVIGCTSLGVVSSVTATFGVAYASKPEYGHANVVSSSTMLWVVIGANLGALIIQPLAAMLADRIGRKPVLITAAVGCTLSSFFWLSTLTSGNGWLIFLGQFTITSLFYSCYNAIWPSFYPEQFAAKVRYSGVAVSTQLGVVLTGFAPSIAAAIVLKGEAGWVPIAIFIAVASAISAVAVLLSRETYNVPLEDLGKKDPRRTDLKAARVERTEETV